MSAQKARIIGLGSFLPERVLANAELEKMVETTDEWIVSRTGMKERRIAGPEEASSHMAVHASRRALESANVDPASIQLVLVATMTPDYVAPSTACLVQHAIGATHAAAFDLQAACTGFLYGLSIAKAYIESGLYQKILLVASEKMSSFVDYKDRNTCILFGDGASAVVISDEGKGLLIDTVRLGAEGQLSDLIVVPGGGSKNPASSDTVAQGMHTIKMNGKEVFKHAVRRMVASAKESLSFAGLTENQINWLVPHQANMRIIDAVAKSFDISSDKVYKTIQKYGNTSASSIPIALGELTREHKIHSGEHILLVAFGAGLTWGSCVLTKE
jgi:3-oxoacyl-[acyl-carrier-protein] synthase-3